jgi:hypothetical protein
MMRFARAALLPLVMLFVVADTASAGLVRAERVIPFRKFTTAALAQAGGGSTNQFLGTTVPVHYIDSTSTFFNSSAAQPALVADTTQWFALPDRGFAPYVLGVDSLSLMEVSLRPTYFRNNVSTADSIQFTLQGSFNGIDLGAGVAADIVEITSTNSFYKVYNWTRGSTAATLTNVNMGMFPLYRVIVKDFTGTQGDYELAVTYWKNVP